MDKQLRSVKITVVIVAWSVAILAAGYRSHTPVVFGRYSWGYAAVLGLFMTLAVVLSLANAAWYRLLYQMRGGIALSAVSLVLSLAMLELGVRFVDPLGISYYQLAGDYTRDKLADEELVFRHKPSWEKRYGGVLVTYNERGLRDRPILPKAKDEYRILALGDSVTFGWGVAQDEIFTVRLEQLLQRRLQRPVRVINSGVGAYNTVQEVTYFKREGITLEPDLVLLTYVQNDIEEQKRPFDPWKESSVLGKPLPDIVLTMLGKLWIYRLAHHTYNYALPKQAEKASSASPQNNTGWRRSMASLDELIVLCREQKIPLIVFFERLDPNDSTLLYEDVVRHAQDVPVKDMGPWFSGIPISSLVNSKVDGHPNGEGHRVIAEHMAETIVSYFNPKIGAGGGMAAPPRMTITWSPN